MTTSAWRVFKDEAVGDAGMVAGKHPLAVRAAPRRAFSQLWRRKSPPYRPGIGPARPQTSGCHPTTARRQSSAASGAASSADSPRLGGGVWARG